MLPTGPCLVDPEYLLSELLKEASRLAQPGSAPIQSAEAVTASSLEMASYGGSGPVQNASRIRLNGVMRDERAEYQVEALRAAYADRDVAAILLEVNTGGGAVTAAEMIRDAVKSRNKPVVVHTHFMCSGGVLATLDADERIAVSETAIIGSIGVVQQIATFMRQFLNSYFAFEYADTSPDKNATTREFLRTGDTSVFKPLLNSLDAIFMKEVTDALNLPAKTRASTLAGGTWLAEEAMARGLVDGIGGTNYALSRLAEASNNYK
jgi:ClpP class serine protease